MHHAPFCCAKLGRSMLMIPAKMANVHTESLMIGSQNHDLLKTPALLFYFQPRARQGAADCCGRGKSPEQTDGARTDDAHNCENGFGLDGAGASLTATISNENWRTRRLRVL